MALIVINDFGGMIPRLDEKRLPDNCAVEAINCDLRGNGIRSFAAMGAAKTIGAIGSGNATKFLAQIPTVAARVEGSSAAAMPNFAPPMGNYAVVAGDELWYAVYLPLLPAGNVVSGAGNIDLTFTDATSMVSIGGFNDQNGVSAIAGDLTTRANGKWYGRRISLAGAVGKTINGLRPRFTNAGNPVLAYYGIALVVNTGTIKTALLDVDRQQEPTTGPLTWVTVDEDEQVFDSHFASLTRQQASGRLVFPVFDGVPRNKQLFVQSYPQNVDDPCNVWRSNHDNFAAAFDQFPVNVNLDYSVLSDFAWLQQGLYGGRIVNYGWGGVLKPTAALGAPSIVGGAAANVTRSYVYTHVNEDGFESGPSPAVTATGRPDGSWNFTAIPTWTGTDSFPKQTPAGSLAHKRRIYRTPATGNTAEYRFVAELADNATTYNDTVADAALGEALPTIDYMDPPLMQSAAYWGHMNVIAAVKNTNVVALSERAQFHAYPLEYEKTIAGDVVQVAADGERLVVLTKGKASLIYGSEPANALAVTQEDGEACIDGNAVLETPIGVIFPGSSGWGVWSGGQYENITAAYMLKSNYETSLDATNGAAGVLMPTSGLIAAFDGEYLLWGAQGAATGHMLLVGSKDRALTKFEVEQTIYSMSYYSPRDSLWVGYKDATNRLAAKLFAADRSTAAGRLKWTWKSKVHRTAKPVSFGFAQIESPEWDSLSASMKAREDALATVPPGTPYSITITGLVQSELWCYLKVWADADKSGLKTLVYDDFVVSDAPIRLAGGIKSDAWQFEIRGNIDVTQIALAESARELNQE